MTENDLRFLMKFPDKCCAQVSRKGELQPCDKVAVGVVEDPEDGWWPACRRHLYGRRVVPLETLVRALTEVNVPQRVVSGTRQA